MNELRAYECFIENVPYGEGVYDAFGEYLGSIEEETTLWGIYYATTPSKAKHQFIQAHKRFRLEYTDPIKVHLLAKNVTQTNDHPEDFEADWRKADLTAYGQKVDADWAKAERYINGKLNLGDMIDELEAGNWEILDLHYEAKLNRVQPSEAIQEVHEDFMGVANTHYDARDKEYKAVVGCLAKWEQERAVKP